MHSFLGGSACTGRERARDACREVVIPSWAGWESGRGDAFLVGVDLGTSEAGVVIDCGVDVVETDLVMAGRVVA